MIQSIFSLLVPLLIIKFRSSRIVKLIGTIGTSYLFGIIYALVTGVLSTLQVIPKADTSAIEIVSYVAISLAIPLLLFSNDIKLVLRLTKKTLLSFLLLIISVSLVSAVLFLVFTKNIEHGAILSGMAVALYTGGTPNLNAVAYVFGLPNNELLLSNMSDIIFGGIFYAFLIFLAKPLTSRFLKNDKEQIEEIENVVNSEDLDMKINFGNKQMYFNLLLSLGLVIISFLAGLGIWMLKGQVDGTMTNYVVPALMIGTTIGGIIFSFNAKVRNVRENSVFGQYFACVFSYSISSMISLDSIGSLSLKIFAVFSIITTMTFFVHMLLCKIFRINADTMITAATAGIYGPAFIPSVTRGIHAEYMLSSGLILGAFGYSIANFLGIAFVKLLMLI